LPSGTFSTADAALDTGRDVLAVPGSILYAGSAGSNRLIRQGASPITCREDLDDALAAAGLVSGTARIGIGSWGRELDDIDEPLLRAVLAHPMHPDAAAEALGLRLEHVLTQFARFEAAGAVARHTDGRYGPC